MSLGNPLALLLAGVSLPLIVAYLHRRRLVQRTVSSAMLYRALVSRQAAQRRMWIPRHLLSLLLALAALSALLWAAIRPHWGESDPQTWIVVLDTSSSMATVGDGSASSRLERAVDELDELIAKLQPDDRIALVTSGPEAVVQAAPTRDHGAILERARALRPAGTNAGDPDAALLVAALCKDALTTHVAILSDGVGAGAPQADCPIHHLPVGEAVPNAGITGFSAREADSLGLTEVFLSVATVGTRPRDALVELSVDGDLVDVVRLELPAQGTVDRLFRLTLPAGEVLSAHLDPEGRDALAHDDHAYATPSSGGDVRVLLIAEAEASFLAEALRLHPRVSFDYIGPADPLPDHAIDLLVLETVYEGQLPAAAHVLAVGESAAAWGFGLAEEIDDPELIRWSFSHPLFRFVSLDDVRMASAYTLDLPETATSLMDTAKGSVAAVASTPSSEVLALGFVPSQSDLVLRVGFANWMANVVEWAAEGPTATGAAVLTLGEPLLGAPAGAVLEPFVSSGPAVAAGDPVLVPGAYRLVDAAGGERGLVTVQLLSEIETAVTPNHQLAGDTRIGLYRAERGDLLSWRTAALLALLALLTEWLLPAVPGWPGRRRAPKATRRRTSRPSQRRAA